MVSAIAGWSHLLFSSPYFLAFGCTVTVRFASVGFRFSIAVAGGNGAAAGGGPIFVDYFD